MPHLIANISSKTTMSSRGDIQMLRGRTVITLHEMKAMGKSIREIARETGHSRNTIRKYLRQRDFPQQKSSACRPSKLDPFKPCYRSAFRTESTITKFCFVFFTKKGTKEGVQSLKTMFEAIAHPDMHKPFKRYETKPEKQSQVDWGFWRLY
jgi:transposase